MNKFIAILIDSFYESWNSKIFHILLGLVVFFLVLILSIGYESPGYDKGVRDILKDLISGSTLDTLTTDQKGNFNVGIKARILLEDPNTYLEGLARTRALLWLEQHRISEGWVKLKPESKGSGDSLQVTMKIANTFRESETLQAITVDRSNVDSILLDDLKTMLAHRQIKDVTVKIVRQEGWRREVEIEGSTSTYHIASSCTISFLFGAWETEYKGVGIANVVYVIQDVLFDWIAGIFGVALAVIACAGFVPTMMQKGSIEMWLSRPMGRAMLLTYKYLGALMFILPLAALLFGGTFVIMGARTGFWNFWFLLSIPTLVISFALLQSISTLIGVLWRNQIVAILVPLFVWFGSWMVHRIYFSDAWHDLLPSWGVDVLKIVHFVSPRLSEISNAALKIMYQGVGLTPQGMAAAGVLRAGSIFELIAVTIGFIAIVHSISCWIFVRRDH